MEDPVPLYQSNVAVSPSVSVVVWIDALLHLHRPIEVLLAALHVLLAALQVLLAALQVLLAALLVLLAALLMVMVNSPVLCQQYSLY